MANESYVQVDLFGNPVEPEVKKEAKKEAKKPEKKAAVPAKKTEAKKAAVSTCEGEIADYNAKTPIMLPARIVGVHTDPIVITKGNLRVTNIKEALEIAGKTEPSLAQIAGASLVEIATAPDGGSVVVFALPGENVFKTPAPKKIFVTPHVYFDIEGIPAEVNAETPTVTETQTDDFTDEEDEAEETEEEDETEKAEKPADKKAAPVKASPLDGRLTDKDKERFKKLCEERGITGLYDVVATADALLCVSKDTVGDKEDLTIGGIKIGPKARKRLKDEKISIRRYGEEYQFVLPYRSSGGKAVNKGSYMESDGLRIPLPVTLVTSGRTFSLTAEMLGVTKSYTTLEAVKEFLKDRYAVNRVGNLTAYYVEEEHRIVAVTQLHSKG